jgi:hypothetical protein
MDQHEEPTRGRPVCEGLAEDHSQGMIR